MMIGFIKQIKWIVVKMVPEKIEPEPEIEQPKYLQKSAMRYPQTAVRAILNETKRLFEGPTFEIVAHALSIHRDDIKSEAKLGQIIKDSRTPINVDIDGVYYGKVKSIYSSIITFATNIQAAFTLEPARTKSINRIKNANRLIVEVIKDSKSIKINVDKYLASDNKYIQAQYDAMRKKVSKIYRKIYLLSLEIDPQKHHKTIKRLLEANKRSDVFENGTLDKLIRENRITSEMATSLANDSATITSIVQNLLKVAELLYVDGDAIVNALPESEVEFEESY